ncbi:DUF5133 domain-containing protein [Streptomyces sp. DSM 41269]|uniref:DUF5133 domain-containing protein n=2 Tax=Streptomyces TaxID=1883 RepID=UPI0027D91C68|nr:DUF5133 domain-containing protein [Streptomyces sp. DSM 41269]
MSARFAGHKVSHIASATAGEDTMLTPSPDVMRTLLARYNELQLRHSQDSDYELQRSLEDVTYTLCVSTGTRTVHDALLAADAILRKAASEEEAAAGIPVQRMTGARPAIPKPRTL